MTQASNMLPPHEVAVGESWQRQVDLPIPFIGDAKLQYDGVLKSLDATGQKAKVEFVCSMVSGVESPRQMVGIPAQIKNMYLSQEGWSDMDIKAGISTTHIDQNMKMTMVITSPEGDQQMDVTQEGVIKMTITQAQ